MEKDKYYTPEIEEFYYGFEYEEYHSYKWIKQSFGDSNGEYHNELSEVWFNIDRNNIRVKYLDKEDIESLGWKLKEENLENIPKYKEYIKDNYKLLQYSNNLIMINIADKYYIFRGIIKNKSELTKIIKQLDIK